MSISQKGISKGSRYHQEDFFSQFFVGWTSQTQVPFESAFQAPGRFLTPLSR